MAHELSKLKVAFPLWRIWWDEDGKIHARRLFPPREGALLTDGSIPGLRSRLERAESQIHLEIPLVPTRGQRT